MSGLVIEHVSVAYDTLHGEVPALKDFSCCIAAGEAVGLAGESGAGKTTLSSAVLGLLPGTARIAGRIFWKGKDLLTLAAKNLNKVRGSQIALIPQASQQVFNPVRTIGHQLVEHLRRHTGLDRAGALDAARQAVGGVGLDAGILYHYPHQLSGGQRQRVAIALSYSVAPALVIADEPTSALDAASQERVISLLQTMHAKSRTALLLISHNPALIARLCPRIIVMADGRLVEQGKTAEVIRSPRTAQAQRLFNACPVLGRHFGGGAYAPLPAAGGERP